MSEVIIALENEDQSIFLDKADYDCVTFLGSEVCVSGPQIPLSKETTPAIVQDTDGWWLVADWFLELCLAEGAPKRWRRLAIIAD